MTISRVARPTDRGSGVALLAAITGAEKLIYSVGGKFDYSKAELSPIAEVSSGGEDLHFGKS